MDDLQSVVERFESSAEHVIKTKALIYRNLLRESTHLDGGNFTEIHPDDLRRLFEEYDRCFFGTGIHRALRDTPLQFSLSKRMTSAAGRTIRSSRPGHPGGVRYEIRVSAFLLFQCFTRDDHRAIEASGIACGDRLEALQIVMEHELIHLIEWILWSKTKCSKPRFQSIASRFFAHRSHTHQLITPDEQARVKFGVRPGDRVGFRFDNADYTGTVARITKRATVLVRSERGVRFSDGKKYIKFYVPVQQLEVLRNVTAGLQSEERS